MSPSWSFLRAPRVGLRMRMTLEMEFSRLGGFELWTDSSPGGAGRRGGTGCLESRSAAGG